MAGNGKGKTGNKVRQSGAKKLYYVYFPQGRSLVLYRPKTENAGMRRIADLTLHLFGVQALHKADQAYVVSSQSCPPPKLKLGKNPQADDFAQFELELHYRKDF